MKKILVVFGTRPEAIKMCPLVKELSTRKQLKVIVCVTGQHESMLDQVMAAFGVKPNYNLHVMKEKQTLFDITMGIWERFPKVIDKEKPDVVLVHGDTTTTFSVSLACFYRQVAIGHVEAGLRTYDIASPYPEEFNRQAVGIMAKYHFAPTEVSKANLIREGKREDSIYVTGNTGIDALRTTISKEYIHPYLTWIGSSRLILITAHRRENLGEPMEHMFQAILKIVNEDENVKALYPVHRNPMVMEPARRILGNNKRIRLVDPLEVFDFHNLMNRTFMILTDSGGIQEEAPALGKPVLVMRNTTERLEGIRAGTLKLVGTNKDDIYQACKTLLMDGAAYEKMSNASNPYGDGYASRRIADILCESDDGGK